MLCTSCFACFFPFFHVSVEFKSSLAASLIPSSGGNAVDDVQDYQTPISGCNCEHALEGVTGVIERWTSSTWVVMARSTGCHLDSRSVLYKLPRLRPSELLSFLSAALFLTRTLIGMEPLVYEKTINPKLNKKSYE
jgi:hypothetical protein